MCCIISLHASQETPGSESCFISASNSGSDSVTESSCDVTFLVVSSLTFISPGQPNSRYFRWHPRLRDVVVTNLQLLEVLR